MRLHDAQVDGFQEGMTLTIRLNNRICIMCAECLPRPVTKLVRG